MQVASLRARLLATLLGAAVVILGIAAAIGLGAGGAHAYARVRGTDDKREADPDEDEDRPREFPRRAGELLQAPPVRAALWGASAGLAVAGRNLRGPGFRVVGLRRVDARTGGAIGVRSAVVGFLFDRAQHATAGLLFRYRMSELAPKLQEIERTHANDSQAHQEALAELYRANALRPTVTCGWTLVGPILTQLVLAIGIRDGRTVRDRLTGTIVVADR